MPTRGTSQPPEPGRPLALTTDHDDAAAVLGVVQSVAVAGTHIGQTARKKVVREAIWYLWEEPRLPRPRIGGKYPMAYPWSAAARDVARAEERPVGGWGLVIEHVHPIRNLVVHVLIEAEFLTVNSLQSVLRSGLASAVITKDEDAQLTRARLATLDVPLDDPWLRYRMAGLAVGGFRPLS